MTDKPSLPKKCVSCAHWGSQPSPRNDDTHRWRWCAVNRPGSAHIDYVCQNYARLSKDDGYARLERWGITAIEDEPQQTRRPMGGVFAHENDHTRRWRMLNSEWGR